MAVKRRKLSSEEKVGIPRGGPSRQARSWPANADSAIVNYDDGAREELQRMLINKGVEKRENSPPTLARRPKDNDASMREPAQRADIGESPVRGNEQAILALGGIPNCGVKLARQSFARERCSRRVRVCEGRRPTPLVHSRRA